MAELPPVHWQARCPTYPDKSAVRRFPVPDEKVRWNQPYDSYKPTDYTALSVAVDPKSTDICDMKSLNKIKFNCFDGDVNRRSIHGIYHVQNSLPLNPVGRTGITGRGCLERWGPNHVLHTILTKWKKKHGERVIHETTGKPVLEVTIIQRSPSDESALHETKQSEIEGVPSNLKVECEETTEPPREDERNTLKKQMVYYGYLDDPRNTDNAWVETVVYSFHDETGDNIPVFSANPGDAVLWKDIDRSLHQHASYKDFLKKTAELLGGHW